ncbi:glycerol-3-phosphate 1-O-acyltransferase PlsY [Listeria welshimeri]|uniref:Glycerol-3-phosphate acyltransferase n=1 Tax=Listeria welshimeri serovar 6b (strain ATCC 35897 / DSM 20650 / CCUG 15529 / CIP 8149 / NCTC 11857 / SLCC 5334 / V8) TaxID=386043 RepID=PLSY_LISW6|nr:glycerol-3-phosphate 1-O-acyltransferase PlsY [Listeria welshimeri]A0AI87.1 RecName: Full=Glycerol-3-phosphate acyltransferase; AltName: Full=Acyl-PO4 G3P acyltransferase; AltName: Full=Acyl-phosphate--glycerol-3-phosphate acyltransferase; AltName: Full=G3P acyltransferase; Short=GPAT; AltName: Full=Lysophosphatidic acid synthase; Short=LPA synthase [Listeria welshimeri serovar 6b str. SLCC5334]MBC1248657.1 glycerol-3-phosphate 1-O-acyltransferase PlsY [Listeria welshimeri]MBC1340497.1 glycer
MTINLILLSLLAYVIGSIPSGLWIGKFFYKKDIREFGSGNLGATNSFRVLGIKAGSIVTVMDILKGTVATLLPFFFQLHVDHHFWLLTGAFAIIGHSFPLFAGFRGGKAVATSAGVILAYAPLLFVAALIIFLLTLKISKYVSLSSMIAALAALLISLFMGDWILIILIACITLFVVWRHRANITRIRNGEEPKIKWM